MSDFFEQLDVGALESLSLETIPVNGGWRPSSDFVICRDADGNPTAVYGEDSWDLNPIRLKANRIPKFYFNSIFDGNNIEQKGLVEEVRYLMFCLMFFAGTGKIGRLSPGLLSIYLLTLKNVARFCYDQRENRLVGALTLQGLFTNPVYLSAYIKWMNAAGVGQSQRALLRALISHMVGFGEERLGYKLQGVFDLDFGIDNTVRQHPVIPTRIYLGLINLLGEHLDQFHLVRSSLEGFISSCIQKGYGYTHLHQIKKLKIDRSALCLDFYGAVKEHDLQDFFVGDYECVGRGVLSSVVLKIQYVLKMIIHAYTGMRDQEVLRLPYSCIDLAEVSPGSVGEGEGIVDPPSMIRIISSTTKFSGYRKSESWLATEEVVKAVEVAQAICRGVSSIYGVDPQKMPLFLNPAIINRSATKISVPHWNDVSKPGFILSAYQIQQLDIDELEAVDPERGFSSEDGFSIGVPWPLTSHQFRRSLAFYGSSSGFISLPSLRRQFKHLTTQMTRYYSNGFERLKTIFGYYDEEAGSYILPKNHVAYEFQMAIPINMAHDLLVQAFGDSSPLFGGVGGYISKQRLKMQDGEVNILDLRAQTERHARDGKIAYRQTLLGGCTKVGHCDSYLLGNFTSCLSCDGAIIKRDKLNEAISDSELELEAYDEGSGEYQLVSLELNKLKEFECRFVPIVEVE